MALNSWQKVDRVIPGKPFGDGSDGNLTVSDGVWGSEPGVGWANFVGSAGSTTGTFADVAYFNGTNGGRVGDIVLIHQTRGTGAGQWEINQIVGRSGSTLTFKEPLKYTYTSSGASIAQIVSSGMYENLTISANMTPYLRWNKSAGGIIFAVVRDTLNVGASVSINGGNGATVTTDNAGGGSGGGFYGGNAGAGGGSNYGFRGEGTAGDTSRGSSANGNGGGGTSSGGDYSGGGGGNGTAGGSGTSGAGGSTAGNAELTNIVFGGGGGGGSQDYAPDQVGAGGGGGGIVIFIAKNINITGGIQCNGGNGGTAIYNRPGGGGGAGGSILFVAQDASLGSGIVTANGGAAGTGGAGAGGAGRIALHYSGSYSGSTSPSLYVVNDPTLIESAGGGSFMLRMIGL